ncbi:MAG: hypothetical protein NZ654_04300, partial [Acidimicrobiales bacterium]|nr:hypothetical protein [Acidimicrobiales bacterium]
PTTVFGSPTGTVVVAGVVVVAAVVVVGATVVTMLEGAVVVGGSVMTGAVVEAVEAGSMPSCTRSSLQETRDATRRATSAVVADLRLTVIKTVASFRRPCPTLSCSCQAGSGIQLPWAP